MLVGGLYPPSFRCQFQLVSTLFVGTLAPTLCVVFLRFASPAAAAGVAERNVAAAAALAAAFEAIATGLQHLAAFRVAAGAGDAATVLRVLALAVAAAQVEIANLDAVPCAGARAGAIAQSLAKALQCLTRGRILA